MRSQTVTTFLSMSALAALSILMLAGSVSQERPDSSENSLSSAISEREFPAPTLMEERRRVRSDARRARSNDQPYLATATIPVPVPQPVLLAAVDQQDIKLHHRRLADATLKLLPPHCRTHLKNFYVKYVDVKQRGLGGKTTIIIDGTVPDEEFIGLLIHECGHVTHSNMPGSAQTGASPFRDGNEAIYNDSPITSFFAISWMTEGILKAGMKKSDFVSGYAQSDAFEDFSETFAMYILHRPALRERAEDSPAIAAKLAWMETHLPLAENPLGESVYTWNSQVPWDVTRLPYELAGTVAGER